MRYSTMLLLAALAAPSCGGDGVPATDARDVPPARLPGDSALPAPLPADRTETLQPGDTARAVPDAEVGTSDAAGMPADMRPAPPASSRPSGQQMPAEPADPIAARASAVDSEAILRRASSAYENIRSLSADFVMNREIPALRQTITSRGTLYQRSPDRIALRFSDPDGDLILGDGEYFWVYYPSVNPAQYMRQPAAVADRSGVDLQAQFVGNPVDRFDATLHGTETVAGRQAHVLTLVPRQRAEYRSLKVWLDTRDSLARRFEIVEHNGTMRRFDLDNIQTNITIPDATFRFTPPPGARNIAPG
jgi:outer membrane lipoprotein carrier protein